MNVNEKEMPLRSGTMSSTFSEAVPEVDPTTVSPQTLQDLLQ